jgi:hypothetical protein
MLRQRPYLRQAVTITGLGCELFEKVHENVEYIFMAFANHFPADSLEGWQGSTHNGQKALDFHARYFDRKGGTADDTIPFSPLEDPEGVLEAMIGDGFFHGQDNAVEYLKRVIAKDGSIKCVTFDMSQQNEL